MEKWSSREQVLLGYNLRDSIGNRSFSVNPSPRTSCQNSDANRRALDSINPSMDFHDVFGGPPRCSVVREPRYSLNEARGEDSGLLKQEALQSQKHVFGEDSPNRRTHLREDFFGDIFGGQDSSRTPRRNSRDRFGSLPASRMLSPIFPSRPKSDTFTGGSSQPPELSLPSKIGKRIDYPTLSSPSGSHSSYKHKPDSSNSFGSSSSPSVLSPKVMAFDHTSPRFPIQPVQAHNDSRNETRTTYRQSHLSNQFSINCEDGSSEAPESASRNLERPDSDNQFHFSIHKWASKGITLLMPAKGGDRSKDRETNGTKVGISPKAVFRGADIPCRYENSSIISRDSMKKENFMQQETKSPSGKPEIVEKSVPASPQASRRTQLNSLHSLLKENDKEPGAENRSHSIMSNGEPDNNLSKGIWNEVPVSVLEEHGSELKNHDNLPNDKSDEHGKETIVLKAGKKEGKLKRSTSSNARKVAEMTSPTVQDLTANPEARVLGSRVKGKVKEFVKIFNQETSQKSTPKVDTKNRSSRVKDAVAHNVEAQITSNTAKPDEEEKMANGDRNTARMDSTIVADEILRETEQADLDIDFIVHHIDDIDDCSLERIDITLPCFESTPESCGDNVDNAEAPRRGNPQKNCPVEQISEEQKQNPQMDQDQELHINDAKIQNWSKGKEGNIRSLLSTLQYVLWPNSGWKPIALVDIIEGNSVKRAYQKALLCLHPDKLQQKGVTVLQKQIAEQVFDILQEAWTEFNLAGSF